MVLDFVWKTKTKNNPNTKFSNGRTKMRESIITQILIAGVLLRFKKKARSKWHGEFDCSNEWKIRMIWQTLLKHVAAWRNFGLISWTSSIFRYSCLYKISVPLFDNLFVTSWVTRINIETQYRHILICGSSSVEHCCDKTSKLLEAVNKRRKSSPSFVDDTVFCRKPETIQVNKNCTKFLQNM